MMTFDTQIDGIECKCRVNHYLPYVPAKYVGPMFAASESMPSEFEFEILDREGHPAPTLQDSLTDKDIDRLQDEYEAAITADKYGLDY